ncbi:MAG: response regulator [Candidatus Theseobacter exili]|nr:response regulator [Candidatus Theseobacter exili]
MTKNKISNILVLEISVSGKKRIMVIDDDEQVGIMLKEFLERRKYDVVIKCRIDNLDEISESGMPDLIFVDYRMRPYTGKDLLEQIRKAQISVPIIMMSAYRTTDGFFEVKNMGAFDYIAKPFDFDEIELILDRLFG